MFFLSSLKLDSLFFRCCLRCTSTRVWRRASVSCITSAHVCVLHGKWPITPFHTIWIRILHWVSLSCTQTSRMSFWFYWTFVSQVYFDQINTIAIRCLTIEVTSSKHSFGQHSYRRIDAFSKPLSPHRRSKTNSIKLHSFFITSFFVVLLICIKCNVVFIIKTIKKQNCIHSCQMSLRTTSERMINKNLNA